MNDQTGLPFFVVSTTFTSGLISAIKTDIVPRLLKDVPDQPTEKYLRDELAQGLVGWKSNPLKSVGGTVTDYPQIALQTIISGQ